MCHCGQVPNGVVFYCFTIRLDLNSPTTNRHVSFEAPTTADPCNRDALLDQFAPRWGCRGFVHALSEIPRREGLRAGFFSGLWPTVAKGAINNCIRFGLYNEMAGALRRTRGEAADEALGPSAAFGLGAAAGAVSAVSLEDMILLFFSSQGLKYFTGCVHSSDLNLFSCGLQGTGSVAVVKL